MERTHLLRTDAERLDAFDPLGYVRDSFDIADHDRIYFGGNSLGRPARKTRRRIEECLRLWSTDVIEGWAQWLDLPERVGDAIGGALLGAAPGQVVIADGTTVDLYKLGNAALDAQRPRRVIVTDDLNFPSDRFVAESLARQLGGEVRWVPSDPGNGVSRAELAAALDDDVALVMVSHVDYRSGAICDLPGITADAHDAGALVLADLCHSVGVVPIELDAWGVDLAVGCSYKYLNGGPGSPAFLYVRQEHQTRLVQPIWGWFGNRDRFAMGSAYTPAAGITGWLSSAPSIIATAGIEASVEIMAEAGLTRLREKSKALTSLAVELFEQYLRPLGFDLASPSEAERRGAHVSVSHPDAAVLVRLLQEEAGVVADCRMPDVVRMAFAPAYTRFVDVWEGFDRLRQLVEEGRHLTVEGGLTA